MLILLDQDGVLADFEHGIAHGWQARYGTPVHCRSRAKTSTCATTPPPNTVTP